MFKPNLQSILSSFSTTITKLQELNKRNYVLINANIAKMATLQEDNALLGKEADDAAAIAERLANLLKA